MKTLVRAYTLTIILVGIFLLSASYIYAIPSVQILGNYAVVGGLTATSTANANFTASGTIAFVTLGSAGDPCLSIGSDGTIATTTCGGGAVAGSNTEIQYNNAGSFAGDSNLTWSSSTLNLTAPTATFKGIVLNPSGTGTQNVIDITPSGAMSTSTMWHGLDIDGSALDPSGFGVEIDGIRIDLSGIDETKTPIIHGLDIRVPFGNDGVHITQGELHMNVTLPSTPGATFTSIDVVVDGSGSAATADYHALDVALTNGSLSSIAAIGTHSGVRVIDQHIVSSFSTPNQGEYAGRKTGGGASWADGIDGIEIFIVNSDEVYIGNTAGAGQFSEIQVVMGTPGTKSVQPTFWYNTAADTWTQFFPADDTDGFQQNGIIRWALSGITSTWTNDGDPGGANASTGYWIKMIRTGSPDPGTPTPTTMKTGIVIKYFWDENGFLDIESLLVNGTSSFTGVVSFGTISAGLWNGTAIDFSTYTNATGGRSITLNGDAIDADLELYTDYKCGLVENLAAADDNMDIWMANFAVTVIEVGVHCTGTCTTTAVISLEDRSGNAMTHTTATSSTGTANTTYIAVTSGGALVAGEGLRFDVDNTPNPETDTYTICFGVTYDD